MSTALDIIESYRAACYTADVPALRACFAEDAHMAGYLGDEYLSGGLEGFFEDVAGHPSMESAGTDYRVEVVSSNTGDLTASITIKELGFFGELSFLDHLSLVKGTDDAWRIASKVFETL